jgi:diaminohydroxyphosphoribosylaminopyrimidine deaminase/5-amino-6-(5-phosphoribosylamino)uracil reductase
VHENKIIGEGWHKQYGKSHAEVNAIQDVKQPELLPESTAYVTLEPCSHFGKTPPCADLLIEKKLKRVVIATLDSNPVVKGNGVKKLQEAAIKVTIGVKEQEARNMNRYFFTFMEKKRPHIVLKWAETADGFVARQDYSSKWISNPTARQIVHKLRTEIDAVMVGTNTAFYDNPQLNVRNWSGRNPIRICIDKQLKIPPHYYLLDNTQTTICFNTQKQSVENNTHYEKIESTDTEFFTAVFQRLYEKKIQSVLVEGGSQVLQQLITNNLWDEAYCFVNPSVYFKTGISAPSCQIKNAFLTRLQDNLLYFLKNI